MTATMSRQHLRFLVVEEVIGSTIVNFLLNAGIAWYLFRRAPSVPMWGASSIAVDTLVTAFVLPVLTALIATFIVRQQVRRGKLLPIPADDIGSSRWLARPGWQRGVGLGVASVVLVAAPLVVALTLIGPAQLSSAHFIWFKGSFAAGLGALVTPLLGWWALADASRAFALAGGRSQE
jgi:hypothetical protein